MNGFHVGFENHLSEQLSKRTPHATQGKSSIAGFETVIVLSIKINDAKIIKNEITLKQVVLLNFAKIHLLSPQHNPVATPMKNCQLRLGKR
jgi:hypothetical protein